MNTAMSMDATKAMSAKHMSHGDTKHMSHGGNQGMQMEHMKFLDLVQPNQATHVAKKSGKWFDPNTWKGGKIPGNGAKVLIPEGIKLTYDQESAARLKTVRVDGSLTFATNKNTKLMVDTFVNSPKGTLNIGTQANPIQADKTAQIIITDDGPINRKWDPKLLSRGLLSHGKVNIHGADKTDFTALAGDALAGSNELVLASAPKGWSVGDRLVLGGTDLRWNGSHADNSRFQDEVLTITEIKGNRVRFVNEDITSGNNTVLRFDHQRPDIAEKGQLKLYVANTSRNVSVSSEKGEGTPTAQRGHVMFMHNPDVRVNNAGFYDLGRSDKRRVVDDPGTNMDGSSGSGRNPRGRYALHFHRTGAEDINGDRAIATGNAVVGSPGWGIVHHDSNALLEDNVVFDVVGAGIVAESGNELGVWRNNLTIKTTGVGWNNINKTRDARDRLFDHGFRGEGYWVQGAAQVAMDDNIAISSNDAGITIFGDTLDPKNDARDVDTIAVKNLPKAIQSKVAVPGQKEVDITDVPLRQFSGFQSYNSNHGIKIWGHMTNFDGHLEFSSPEPRTAHNARSKVNDFRLWNNHWSGLSVQYSSNMDFQNGLIVGDVDNVSKGDGIFHNHATFNNTYNNLTVRGFQEGMKLEFTKENEAFLSSTVANSRFSDNTYNFSKIGGKMSMDRPDDFPSMFKIRNTTFQPSGQNAAPRAQFGLKNAGGLGRIFDASASFDTDALKPDGKKLDPSLPSRGIVGYAWDFNNDGRIDGYGRTTSHVFDRAGKHDVTLRVWDNQGATQTLTKRIDVQPTAYPNAFQNGDFSGSESFARGWQSNSQWSDKTWYAMDNTTRVKGTAQLSKQGQWNSGIGQVIESDGLHRGQQTLSLKLQNIEGSTKSWQNNKIQVQLWGVNGQFGNNLWAADGPAKVGTLPMASKQLLNQNIGGENGEFFDWKTMKWDVNLGKGYDYLLFQVNGQSTGDKGDRVALDNVRLTGAANSIPSNSPNPRPTPPGNTPRPPRPPLPGNGGNPPYAGPGRKKPLNLATLESYDPGGQDKQSRTTLTQGGKAVRIRGNAWKALPIDYKITPDTKLSVEFRSNGKGEIQAIGFDRDKTFNKDQQARTFKLTGSQEWGNQDFDDYVTKAGWKSYEIPVGEYFTGNMPYLVLVNDHDVTKPNAMSQFRNIRLFEDTTGMGDRSTNRVANALLPKNDGLPTANILATDTPKRG